MLARLHAGRALALEGLSKWESALKDYDQALDFADQAGSVEGQLSGPSKLQLTPYSLTFCMTDSVQIHISSTVEGIS